MATLSEMVETLARVEGIEPATVGLIARNVREAGLITTRGRGLSAANMTFTDAANLLIAVNATVSAREAPQTLRNYRCLNTGWDGRNPAQLGDALEQIIQAASNKTLPLFYLSSPMPTLIFEEFRKNLACVELIFHKPVPYASLTISALDEKYGWVGRLFPGEIGFEHAVKYATRIMFEFKLSRGQLRGRPKRYGDRRDTTAIGYSTIRAISELLGP